MSETFKSIFGIEFSQVSKYFSDLSKPDKNNVVPRGRVINVYLVIKAENELLIRHEGGEDISLLTIDGKNFPIILYEKFQSVFRRKELELLRSHYDQHKVKVDEIRQSKEEWFCALRPSREKGRKSEEHIKGLCGECPDCMTFGFAVKEGGEFNVKSRIEGDLFFATTSEEKSVVVRTFNAIDDLTHTTFIDTSEGRTGALFRLSLIKPGTLFVGKIVMKDIGLNDFLLKMAALSTVTRIGGRTTHFGAIKIYIPAIMFSKFEVSSSFEMFMATREKEKVEEVITQIKSELEKKKKGVLVDSKEDYAEAIRESMFDEQGNIKSEIVLEAWKEAKNFKESINEAI